MSQFDRLLDAVLDRSIEAERLPVDLIDIVVRELRRHARTATGPRVRKLREKPAMLHGAVFVCSSPVLSTTT